MKKIETVQSKFLCIKDFLVRDPFTDEQIGFSKGEMYDGSNVYEYGKFWKIVVKGYRMDESFYPKTKLKKGHKIYRSVSYDIEDYFKSIEEIREEKLLKLLK